MIEVAALLSAIVQKWEDFIIVLFMLLVNAFLEFFQEHRALNTLKALKQNLANEVTVCLFYISNIGSAITYCIVSPMKNLLQKPYILFTIVGLGTGEAIPLTAVARISETREFSRVVRINHQRTVTISGDIDSEIANTSEVINDTKKRFLPQLLNDYPGLVFSLEGEVKNSNETNLSVLSGFAAGIVGVFLLLSLTFRNYREPLVVLINIPLALIGVIWGHLLMGLDMTLPSIIGFVSLAGIVVNDSILLVEYVKIRSREGMPLLDAAGHAVRDRFRAIFLTSVTTIAGMFPLLLETSLQAQVLVPLVASVVFGMLASTFLTLLVLPASYTILEDLGFVEAMESGELKYQ